MDCEFCKKTFSSKSNLYTHQHTAKYCLQIQGESKDKELIFECEFCQKILTQQKSLDIHTISCKEKKKKKENEKEQEYFISLKRLESEIAKIKKSEKEKIKEKNEYIAKLETTIEKLEAKIEKFEDLLIDSKREKKTITSTPTPIPNTTNNTTNIVINYLNLNDIPKMTAFLEEKLDKEVVAGGQKSLAFLLSNTVLKDKYKCVDPSRQNFEFTNELGEVERDVKAKKLTNALIKSDICSKSGEIGMELWKKEDGSTDSLRYEAHSKNVLEMINFTRDNSTFRSELSALTS